MGEGRGSVGNAVGGEALMIKKRGVGGRLRERGNEVITAGKPVE